MSHDELSIDLKSENHGETLVFKLRGSLDIATSPTVRAALDAVLGGQPVSSNQKPSIGCNIKWKPGNEPEYFG